MSDDDIIEDETDQLEQIEELLAGKTGWARQGALSTEAVDWLVAEVKQLREERDRPRPQGVYTLTLGRAGSSPIPLVRFRVAVGGSLQWVSELPFFELQPTLSLDYTDPGA